jgi:hypothetical protein
VYISGGLTLHQYESVTVTRATKVDYDRERIEDIGYMTCMTLLLGNYAQTGHFAPLPTHRQRRAHLAGLELGGCAMTTASPNIRSR